MGVDTHLLINSKWRPDDIATILKKHFGKKEVKVNPSSIPADLMTITFESDLYNYGRCMYFHNHVMTPIGSCCMLSLGYDKEAVTIMKRIANVIGGILEERDSDGKMELFDGKLTEEDSLPYFIRYSILNNECNGDSIAELNQSIKEWINNVHGKDSRRAHEERIQHELF